MAASSTVRALRVHAFGEPPRLDRLTLPPPGEGEALVRLEATVIGHHDLGIAAGILPGGQPLPFVPGLEGAGRVEAVGEGVDLEPGTRVRVFGGGLGAVQPGTWSEAVVAPAVALTPVPEGLDPALAAACGSVANTAWAATFDLGGLQPGEGIGVTGATGAVGSLVLQLVARRGSNRVVAWARAPERIVGAAEALGYDEDAGEPVDLLVDTVGGASLPRRLRSVRPGGRAVLLGYTAGEQVCLDLPALLHGDVSLLPLNMRRRRVPREVETSLLADVAAGRLHVAVERVPPTELEAALVRLRAGRLAGRLVVVW